jgi:hypothetical protein
VQRLVGVTLRHREQAAALCPPISAPRQPACIFEGFGDAHAAERCQRAVLALRQREGGANVLNHALRNIAVALTARRAHAEALELLDLAAASARERADGELLAWVANTRAASLGALRRRPEALAAQRECVREAWRAGAPEPLTYGLWNLPRHLAHERRAEAAAQLIGFSHRHCLNQGGDLVPDEKRALAQMRRLAAVQIGARRCDALIAQGATLSLAEAVRLALSE